MKYIMVIITCCLLVACGGNATHNGNGDVHGAPGINTTVNN
jgi:hypothetical protein